MRLRSLSGLGAEEAAWFAPATARLRALTTDAESRVHDFFTVRSPIHVGRAPGRLDVMGGIADYSGALVLQLPLARATFALVQRQRAAVCDVATRLDDGWRFASVDMERLALPNADDGSAPAASLAGSADHWAAYVVGVVQQCVRRAGSALADGPGGFRILIASTVPRGKGVSSSAALEVATMSAVNAALGQAARGADVAHACQWVENHIVGAPCGIMDQMTSALGRRGQLLRLLCQPDIVQGFLDVPDGVGFYGIASGARHSVSGDAYARVRTAAFMGYRMIAECAALPAVRAGDRVRVEDSRWHGYLANIPPAEFRACFEQVLPERMTGAEFLDRYGGTTDTVTRVRRDTWYPIRHATAHPIHEHSRVNRFALLLAHPPTAASAQELGTLMRESHASYGACGLGSTHTDRLVTLVAEAGAESGLHGAKITGGGSGGTVAILGAASAGEAVRRIAERYAGETGQRVDVFTESGPGAEDAGVLVLEPRELEQMLA